MKPQLVATRLLSLALLALMAGAAAAHAAVYTWTQSGGASPYSWSDTANWDGGSAPPAGGAADTEVRIFADTATALPAGLALATNNDLAAGVPSDFDLNLLTLNGLAPAAGSATVTLQGGTLNFVANGVTTPVLSANGLNNGSGTLACTLTNAVTVASPLTVQGDGTATVTLAGSVRSEDLAFTKAGSGTLILAGNNDFNSAGNGNVVVSGGVLRATGLTSLGQASAGKFDYVTLDTGAASPTLQLWHNGTGDNGTIKFSPSYGLYVSVTGTGTANLGLANNGANTGNQVQMNTLTLAAGSTLQLSAANGYTASFATLAGTGSGDRTLDMAADVTVGTISGTASRWVKTGSGTLTITGAGYASGWVKEGTFISDGGGNYTVNGGVTIGDTTVGAPTARVEVTGTRLSTFGGSATINRTGTLDQNAQSQTIGTVAFAGGGAIETSGGKLFSQTLGYTAIPAGGETATIASNIEGSWARNDWIAFQVTVADDPSLDEELVFSGNIAPPAGYPGWAISKLGAGTLVLQGTNSWTGQSRVNAGTLSVSSDANLGNGNWTFDGSGAIRITGTSAFSSAKNFTLNSGVTGTFEVTNTAGATLSGAIGSSGNLRKAGGGTLTLSGANSYTGYTIVDGGTLKPGVAGAVPNANRLYVKSGTFDLNGFDFTTYSGYALTLGGGAAGTTTTVATGTNKLILANGVTYDAANDPGTAAITGNLDLGAASRTFNVGDSSAVDVDLRIDAPITGSATAGLTKTGAGTLLLAAANSFPGAIAVQGGVLRAGHAAALPAGRTLSVGAGYLDLNGYSYTTTGTLTFGALGGTGYAPMGITTGSGTLTLGGDVLYNTAGSPGPVTVSGNLDLGAADRLFTVNDGTSAADVTIDAAVGGSVKLTKSGTGVLVLAGDSTFSGDLDITAGTLRLGHVNALGGTAGKTSLVAPSGSCTLDFNGLGTAATPIAEPLQITYGAPGYLTNSSGTPAYHNASINVTGRGYVSGTGTITLAGAITGGTWFLQNNGTLILESSVAPTSAFLMGGNSASLLPNQVLKVNTTAAMPANITIQQGFLDLTAADVTMPTGGQIYFNPTTTGSVGSVDTGAHTLTLAGTATIHVKDQTAVAVGDAFTVTGSLLLSGGGVRSMKVGRSNLDTVPIDFDLQADISEDTAGTSIRFESTYAQKPGTVYLSGNNSFTGYVETYQGQSVMFDSIGNVNGGPSALGNPSSVANGQIRLRGNGNGSSLIYVGAGHSTDRTLSIDYNGDGTNALQADGSGPLAFTTATTITYPVAVNRAGNRNLVLTGTNTGANTLGGINPGASPSAIVTLVKNGPGTWVLAGANAHTGGTTVNAGLLKVDHNSALGTTGATILGGTLEIGAGRTITNNLTLNGGELRVNGTTQTGTLTLTAGTLSGKGTVSQPVTAGTGVTIAAGSSPGTLTLADGLTVLGGGVLQSELWGLGAGEADRVTVSGGTVDLTGGAALDVLLNGPYYSQIGDTFAVLTFPDGALAGTFSETRFFGWNTPTVYAVDYHANRVDVRFLVSIPEPGSLALLACAGLCGLRRRRPAMRPARLAPGATARPGGPAAR